MVDQVIFVSSLLISDIQCFPVMFFVNWVSFRLTDLAVTGEAEQYKESKKTLNVNDGGDLFPSGHTHLNGAAPAHLNGDVGKG